MKIKIAPKKERDAYVVATVRKLRSQYDKLREKEDKIQRRLAKMNEQIEVLQGRCPHRRKKWWYGDISEGWDCQDCGVAE